MARKTKKGLTTEQRMVRALESLAESVATIASSQAKNAASTADGMKLASRMMARFEREIDGRVRPDA